MSFGEFALIGNIDEKKINQFAADKINALKSFNQLSIFEYNALWKPL